MKIYQICRHPVNACKYTEKLVFIFIDETFLVIIKLLVKQLLRARRPC